MKMNPLDGLAWLLIIIGGINWGLVGWLKYNLVDKIFGVGSTGSRVIYAIVGVAAIYSLVRMIMMLAGSNQQSNRG